MCRDAFHSTSAWHFVTSEFAQLPLGRHKAVLVCLLCISKDTVTRISYKLYSVCVHSEHKLNSLSKLYNLYISTNKTS